MNATRSDTKDCVDCVMSLSVGAALGQLVLEEARASPRPRPAATAGVNSGKTLAAIVNSSGSLTSSQAMKKRSSLSRASRRGEHVVDGALQRASASPT